MAIDVPPPASGSRRVQCTYAELAKISETITERLTPRLTGECLIALLLPRTSVLAFAAQLGVLRAGAGYVPIDPALPDGRVADILADARPLLLLTDDHGAERAARLGIAKSRVMVLDGDASSAYAEARSAYKPAPPSPDALAYVIYTSGTTGKPKGVMVTHRAIANLVASDIDEYKLRPGDRAAQTSSHGYDSSIEETWLAFASGATLVVVDDEIVRLGPDFVPWLERERMTVLCPSPTLLRSMGRRDATGILPRLKLVYVGGERMPQDVTDAWAPGRRLVNGYGPTECAVTATRTALVAHEPVTIGRPIPGVEAWILDGELNEVAAGESGELCLGGVGLARGYWNAPELTARAFPTHPQLGRIYRTGDLAHRLPDGRIVCAGRLDAQVKIRGHRVELEEIDTHLTGCAGVRAAACALSTHSGPSVLITAVVPRDASAPPSADSLRAALRVTLPGHMVPSRFHIVEALPVAPSGKLDRAAIVAMDMESAREPVAPIDQPTNAMEATLAARVRAVLRMPGSISLDAHLFDDLGADSLAAAELVTLLREDPATVSATVRDVYEAPTVRGLAARLSARHFASAPSVTSRRNARVSEGRPITVTIVQALWLALSFAVGAALSGAFALELLPRLAERLGLVAFLLLTPVAAVAAFIAYAVGATALAVITKRRLIGRYTPTREPVWSNFYLRHWLVIRSAHAIPWWLIEGTELQSMVLRALGARIGKRVHLHRGVNLRDGGWDLLTIGDNVTVSQEASLQLVDFEDGQIIIGPVTLENDVTLDVRAGVGAGAYIERGGCLTPHSMLRAGARIPAGECWDGIPAQRTSAAPPRPTVSRATRDLSPLGFAAWVMLGRLGGGALIALPYVIVAMLLALAHGHDSARFLNWLANPRWTFTAVLSIVVPLPIGLMSAAIAARALGTITPGVIGGWSAEYVRVMTKTQSGRSGQPLACGYARGAGVAPREWHAHWRGRGDQHHSRCGAGAAHDRPEQLSYRWHLSGRAARRPGHGHARGDADRHAGLYRQSCRDPLRPACGGSCAARCLHGGGRSSDSRGLSVVWTSALCARAKGGFGGRSAYGTSPIDDRVCHARVLGVDAIRHSGASSGDWRSLVQRDEWRRERLVAVDGIWRGSAAYHPCRGSDFVRISDCYQMGTARTR